MTETHRINSQLKRAQEGQAWHGPSLRELLDGVTAEQAAAKPIPNAHSIWELVLHMTGWAREVTARIGGRAAQEPEAGDWPAVTDPIPARWQQAQDELFAVHRSLAAAIRAMDASLLEKPVLDYRDDAMGTGLSHYLTLHGIVNHTVYHSGQIAQLKRLMQ